MTENPIHPATKALLRWFEFEHLPAGRPRNTSLLFHAMAYSLVADLPEGPELTVCLRKLLEAKDCAVRAALS